MDSLKKILFIGAGFSSSCAARMLADLGHEVHIFEKEDIAGGMARSFQTEGMVYEFGPHVLAKHHGSGRAIEFIEKYIDTESTAMIASFFRQGKYLNYPLHIRDIEYLEEKRNIEEELKSLNIETVDETNFETYLISKVGKTLYKLFYKEFTEKFWQVDAKTLSASWAKIRRLGENLNEKTLFFTKSWCAYPKKDFNQLFKNILKGIDVKYGVTIKSVDLDEATLTDSTGNTFTADVIISSLSVDELLDFKYGKLDYSGFDIEPVVVDKDYYHKHVPFTNQHYAMVYYPESSVDYCRITEYKSFNNKAKDEAYQGRSVITIERPTRKSRFYPFTDKKNEERLRLYIKDIAGHHNIFTLGRMGLYKYTTIDTITEQIFRFIDCIGANFKSWENMTPAQRVESFYKIRGEWNN